MTTASPEAGKEKCEKRSIYMYKGSAPRAADAARYARAKKISTNKCEGGRKKRSMI